jgi:Rrf2 family protein
LQVSAKTDYALRAAAELARAATEETGPVKGEWISEAQGIPKKFMENILHDLKRAGIVRTRRGASGGYWLARPPEDIPLAEVIRAVEGPLANVRGEWPEAVEYPGAAGALACQHASLRSACQHAPAFGFRFSARRSRLLSLPSSTALSLSGAGISWVKAIGRCRKSA